MKSWEEKVVGMAIKNLINDEIGYRENSYLDGDYFENYDTADFMAIVNNIVNTMMSAEVLYTEGSFGLVVTKEVRFLGKTKVREMVVTKLFQDYIRSKWIFPHNEFDLIKILADLEKEGK